MNVHINQPPECERKANSLYICMPRFAMFGAVPHSLCVNHDKRCTRKLVEYMGGYYGARHSLPCCWSAGVLKTKNQARLHHHARQGRRPTQPVNTTTLASVYVYPLQYHSARAPTTHRAKSSSFMRGMMPAPSPLPPPTPCMLKVFPLPVCPYAKIVVLKPVGLTWLIMETRVHEDLVDQGHMALGAS